MTILGNNAGRCGRRGGKQFYSVSGLHVRGPLSNPFFGSKTVAALALSLFRIAGFNGNKY